MGILGSYVVSKILKFIIYKISNLLIRFLDIKDLKYKFLK